MTGDGIVGFEEPTFFQFSTVEEDKIASRPKGGYVFAFGSDVQHVRAYNADSVYLSQMLIAVGVKPGRKAKVWCEAAGGNLSVIFLSFLEKELAKVPPIDAVDGPIAFMVKVALWGRQVAGFPELPTKWTAAAAAEGKICAIPDGLFKLIWPD